MTRGQIVVDFFKQLAFDPTSNRYEIIAKWADFLSFGNDIGDGSGFQPYLLDNIYRRDGVAIGPHQMGEELFHFVFGTADIPWWFAEITKGIELPGRDS
jgi:hypothetical protein